MAWRAGRSSGRRGLLHAREPSSDLETRIHAELVEDAPLDWLSTVRSEMNRQREPRAHSWLLRRRARQLPSRAATTDCPISAARPKGRRAAGHRPHRRPPRRESCAARPCMRRHSLPRQEHPARRLRRARERPGMVRTRPLGRRAKNCLGRPEKRCRPMRGRAHHISMDARSETVWPSPVRSSRSCSRTTAQRGPKRRPRRDPLGVVLPPARSWIEDPAVPRFAQLLAEDDAASRAIAIAASRSPSAR